MGKHSVYSSRYSGRKRGVQMHAPQNSHSRDFHRSNLVSAMDAFNCSRTNWHRSSYDAPMERHSSPPSISQHRNSSEQNLKQHNSRASSSTFHRNKDEPRLTTTKKLLQTPSHSDVSNITENALHIPPVQIEVKQNDKVTDLKLSDFLVKVCSQDGVNDDNVDEVFIRELASTLLRLTDVLVDNKSKIYKIVSHIIKPEVQCSESTEQKIDSSSRLEVSSKAIEFNDPRLNKVCSLMEIDEKIEALMKKKMELYPIILRPNAEDIINLDHYDNNICCNIPCSQFDTESIVDDKSGLKEIAEKGIEHANAYNVNPPTSNDNCVPMSNVHDLCRQQSNLLKLVKIELLTAHNIKTEPSENMFTNYDSNTPSNALDPSVSDNSSSAQDTSFNCTSFSSKTQESVSFPGAICEYYSDDENNSSASLTTATIFDVPAKNNKITCIQILKHYLIAGCDDGCLMLFSIKSGCLMDLVFPHEKPIVSITVSQNKIITASQDSWLKCYNLVSKKIKSLSVNYPISCTELSNGILFVGTTTGHMNKFNIKSMTYLASAIQISSNMVISIKSYNENILVVACEGKPVSLRYASDGAILQTVKLLHSVDGIVLTTKSEKIIAYRDERLLVLNSLTGQFSLNDVNFKVYILKCYKGIVFVAGKARDQQEGILLCYSEEIQEMDKKYLPKGTPLTMFLISNSYIVVSTDEVKLTVLNLASSVSQHIAKN